MTPLTFVYLLAVLSVCDSRRYFQGVHSARVRPQLAHGSSSSAEAKGGINVDTRGAFDACYCMTKGSDECPYSKNPEAFRVPSNSWEKSEVINEEIKRARFFHPEDGLCCKWASESMFSWKGWSYEKQPQNSSRCSVNVAKVPETSCCILNGISGPFGVRINKASRKFTVKQGSYWEQMMISTAITDVSSITGSADHNGAKTTQEDAQAFVNEQLAWLQSEEGSLECQSGIENMMTTEVDDAQCKLMSGPPKECCCPSVSLQLASRCLPNPGSPTEAHAQSLVWDASVRQYSSHGYTETEISWENIPISEFQTDTEGDQQAPNDPDDGHTWDWDLVNTQYDSVCSKKASVKTVEDYQKSYMSRCGSITCMKYKKAYRQKQRTECVQKTFTRKCGSGLAFYEKRIPQGTCMTDSSGLVQSEKSNYLWRCPASDENSRANKRCTCPSTC